MGFVTGPGNQLGTPIAVAEARRAYLRTRARQRLERARHSGLGVSAARAVSRQIVRDDDLAVDRHARCARTIPRRGTASGAGAARLPARRRSLGVRDRACGRSADTLACASVASRRKRSRRRPFADMYWNVAQQLAHATVNGAVDAPGRSLRVGNDQRLGARNAGKPDRADVERRAPDRASRRREAQLPRRRRRGDAARLVRKARRAPHRLRRSTRPHRSRR